MKKKLFATLAVAAGSILAVAVPLSASAHVTITPGAAAPGSYALITFKVPNESETAATNRIEVDIPSDTPFLSVSYVPVAGWTADLVTETLPKPVKVGGNELKRAVTKIIWTAQPGHEITAGQLQLFPVSVAVPDTGKVTLKTLQGYSDGSTVSWSGTTEKAEHPAPVLYVNDEAPTAHGAATSPSVSATEVPTPASAASGSDVVARGLGIGGLVLGAIGLVLGVVALRRGGTR
ncbi:YcnI family copper-binding membrane protein [Parafrigoribacterium soli]|uniref:YcnI family copper-binding membrane protein n=1 Tax=Parafrigoribacterium soli TaxID=3144663 RepID=UPI0032EF5CE4